MTTTNKWRLLDQRRPEFAAAMVAAMQAALPQHLPPDTEAEVKIYAEQNFGEVAALILTSRTVQDAAGNPVNHSGRVYFSIDRGSFFVVKLRPGFIRLTRERLSYRKRNGEFDWATLGDLMVALTVQVYRKNVREAEQRTARAALAREVQYVIDEHTLNDAIKIESGTGFVFITFQQTWAIEPDKLERIVKLLNETANTVDQEAA